MLSDSEVQSLRRLAYVSQDWLKKIEMINDDYRNKEKEFHSMWGQLIRTLK